MKLRVVWECRRVTALWCSYKVRNCVWLQRHTLHLHRFSSVSLQLSVSGLSFCCVFFASSSLSFTVIPFFSHLPDICFFHSVSCHFPILSIPHWVLSVASSSPSLLTGLTSIFPLLLTRLLVLLVFSSDPYLSCSFFPSIILSLTPAFPLWYS